VAQCGVLEEQALAVTRGGAEEDVQVLELDSESLDEATELLCRRVELTMTIQDGDCQLSDGTACVAVVSRRRTGS
jgi:uncharacterized protein YaeQ